MGLGFRVLGLGVRVLDSNPSSKPGMQVEAAEYYKRALSGNSDTSAAEHLLARAAERFEGDDVSGKCIYIHLSFYLSIWLSIHPSIYLSIYVSISIYFSLRIYLSIDICISGNSDASAAEHLLARAAERFEGDDVSGTRSGNFCKVAPATLQIHSCNLARNFHPSRLS